MGVIGAVLTILALIIIGASMLTLLGIVLSLGYYDKKEVRAKYGQSEEQPVRWYETPHMG